MGKRKLYSEALKKARPRVNRWANEAERADRKVELAGFDAVYASQEGDAHLARKKTNKALRLDKVANSLSRRNHQVALGAEYPNLMAKLNEADPKVVHQHRPDGLSKREWRRNNPGQRRKAPWRPKQAENAVTGPDTLER